VPSRRLVQPLTELADGRSWHCPPQECTRNKNVVARDRLPFSSNLRNLRFQIRNLGHLGQSEKYRLAGGAGELNHLIGAHRAAFEAENGINVRDQSPTDRVKDFVPGRVTHLF